MEVFTPKDLRKSVACDLIEKAHFLENSRDLESIGELLAPFWKQIESKPDFRSLEADLAAGCLRVAGYYLCLLGKARTNEDFQSRGKELLSEAMHLFERIGEKDLANEARNKLGIAYEQEGLLEDAAPFFLEVMGNYDRERLNVNYLQAATNYLIVLQFRGHFTEALEHIRDIEIGVEVSENILLKVTFHLQAAMIRRRNNPIKSLAHFEECSKFSRLAHSWRTLGINLNNQCFFYLDSNQTAEAHRVLDEAISIFRQLNDTGYLGDCLDSKAQVCLREKNPEAALIFSNDAVEMLTEGDKKAYCNALWMNIKIQMLNGHKAEGFEKFAELYAISVNYLGETSAKSFTKQLGELIELKKIGYKQAVGNYKKVLIVEAFKTHRLSFTATAAYLEETELGLAKVISDKFPEIYQELGMTPYISPELRVERVIETVIKDINILKLDYRTFRFSPDCDTGDPASVKTYFFASGVMHEFYAANVDAIVAIKPQLKALEQTTFLIKLIKEEIYFIGEINFDEYLQMHYFMSFDKSETYPMSEVKVLGTPFAFCDLAESERAFLYFQPLPKL